MWCDIFRYAPTWIPPVFVYEKVHLVTFSNGHTTGRVIFVDVNTIHFGNLVMAFLYKGKPVSVHAEKARGEVGK
jgi:hypothetical protein